MTVLGHAFVVAATLTRFLDPYTIAYQSDEGNVGINVTMPARSDYWPMPNGLKNPLAENLEPRIIHTHFYVFDEPQPGYDENTPSPLFKVNQVGYLPWAPKYAYLGAWLGPHLGAWQPHDAMTGWQLVNAATGEIALDSTRPPFIRVTDGLTKEGTPFTGEDTYEMDFSSVTNEGVYFVRVPGVGRSADFCISASAAEDAFRVHMGGLYQKRCGVAKEEPWTHWTSGPCHESAVRGRFPPSEGKLEPKASWFEIIRYNTDWDNGELVNAVGGWHDAADYDRRPMHLNIVNDLCAVYLMKRDNFRDGQLMLPENGNGIPDILDEAEWGLRHLLASQEKDGGVGTWIETVRHPKPGESAEQDKLKYAISRKTRRSSLMFAAHAAILARCNDTFRKRYLVPARMAWQYALNSSPETDVFEVKRKRLKVFKSSEAIYWKEPEDLPAEYLAKAAINLYALTGDSSYLEPLRTEMPRMLDKVKHDASKWPPLLFSGEMALGDQPAELKEFIAAWKKRTLNMANTICAQIDASYAHRAPWYAPQQGSVHGMAWGCSHPLRRAQYLVAAHGMTGDDKYLRAMSIANDFHNGCNPSGTTLTSGLGTVYPVAFLDLPSYVDGIAEYVPGITPYRWTYGMPPMAIQMAFGGDKAYATRWPIWRRYANLENQTVAVSEFTVWETIAPAASVTAYLMTPSDSKPQPQKSPAGSLCDLPGYWALP